MFLLPFLSELKGLATYSGLLQDGCICFQPAYPTDTGTAAKPNWGISQCSELLQYIPKDMCPLQPPGKLKGKPTYILAVALRGVSLLPWHTAPLQSQFPWQQSMTPPEPQGHQASLSMHYDRTSLPQTAHNALQPKNRNYICEFLGYSDSVLEQRTKVSSTINCKVKITAHLDTASLCLPGISDFEFLVATGLPSSKKTFLDKVCTYTLQLVDSSISPGWLFLVHVQCSAETVNTLSLTGRYYYT